MCNLLSLSKKQEKQVKHKCEKEPEIKLYKTYSGLNANWEIDEPDVMARSVELVGSLASRRVPREFVRNVVFPEVPITQVGVLPFLCDCERLESLLSLKERSPL